MEDDWEFLHNSEDDSDNSIALNSDHSIIKGIDADDFNNSIIRSDYFSIHAHNPNFVAEESSVESDNPSWIDPESVIPYPSPHLWSDSSSDLSDHHHVTGSETEDLRSDDSQRGLELSEGKEVGNGVKEAKSERNGVWWNLPLELLKYCVFRANSVWSVSVAAAVLGLVILGRRLYKMKKKTRSLPLKLTLDDKKVSQFMNRAARLNEAFSVVKRVPISRPSLPAPGMTSWPIMSLR